MISKEDFIKKIKAEVFPTLRAANAERKKVLLMSFLWIIGGIGIIYLEGLWTNGDLKKYDPIVWIGVFAIVCGIWGPSSFRSVQKAKFSEIFLHLLGDLKPGQKAINEELLSKSQLFAHFDRYDKDDEFSGVFNNTSFSVSEWKLIRNAKYFGEGEPIYDNTFFSGVIIHITMKKRIKDHILLFNKWLPIWRLKLQKVKLESIRFSRAYQTYAQNQVKARILLTPDFMERLEHLKRCFNGKRNIFCSFKSIQRHSYSSAEYYSRKQGSIFIA